MKKGLIILVSLLSLSSMLFAKEVKVKRVGAEKSKDLSGKWNDNDVQIVCNELIEKCIASPRIARFESENGRAPLVIIGRIKNESDELLDTSIVAKRLQTAILNSGVLEFVASSNERTEIREEKFDQSEYASMETAKAIDNEEGADFMMQGSVRAIVETAGKESFKTYDVTLTLTNIETNRLVWQEQSTVRKYIKSKKKR